MILAPPMNDGSTHENEQDVDVMSVTRKSSQGPGGTTGSMHLTGSDGKPGFDSPFELTDLIR